MGFSSEHKAAQDALNTLASKAIAQMVLRPVRADEVVGDPVPKHVLATWLRYDWLTPRQQALRRAKWRSIRARRFK